MTYDPLNPKVQISEDQKAALEKLNQSILLLAEAEQALSGAMRLEDHPIRQNGYRKLWGDSFSLKGRAEKMLKKLQP